GIEQCAGGAGPVRVLPLPPVAELRDRALLAFGHEDRVEAEAFRPLRLFGDPSFERPGASKLVGLGRERDQLAGVARPPAATVDPRELAQHPAHLVAGRAPRRVNTRPAAETCDFDARVLTEHPFVRR